MYYPYESSFNKPKERNLQSEIVQRNLRNNLNGDRSLMRSKSCTKLKNTNIEWHFQMKHYIQHRMKVLNAKPTIDTKLVTRSNSQSRGSSNSSSKLSTRPSTSTTLRSNNTNSTENYKKKKKEIEELAQKKMRESMLRTLSRINLDNKKEE
uniref:Uncharacterized protein n=1 Tax=Parastrongyloides trichosuri TaxID=131310 RepID=A0A0N4Z6N5_PARTI